VHLIRRFFGFLAAQPLTPLEQQQVRNLLTPDLARAFFSQRPEDQRHALDVQHRVGDAHPIAEAALLHDLGKSQSNLGAIPRSLATLCGGLGLPTTGSWTRYLDHGPRGAEMLETLQASNLTIGFARSHPGSRPKGIDAEAWCILEEADNG
jgi:hypothetical protein